MTVAVTREQVLDVVHQIEPRFRDAAARLGPDALPILEELAWDPDEHVAAASVHLAVLIDRVQASELVVRALDNPLEVVRVTAAGELAALDGPTVPDAIVRALRDPDPGVRRAGLRSAVTQPGSSKVIAEVERLSTTEPEQHVRWLAVRVLPRVQGEPPSLEEVNAVLQAGTPDADTAAALGPEAMLRLAEVARERGMSDVAAAVRLGGSLPGQDVAQVLVAATDNPDPEVRVAALGTMRNVAKAEIGPVVAKLLTDPDLAVRQRALQVATEAVSDPEIRKSMEAVPQDSPTRELLDRLLRPANRPSGD